MPVALKNAQAGLPWWRFGLVWMVLGGPAIVVVAGFSTLYIAITNPDPVIKDTARTAMQLRQGMGYAPALQGRNHAATGTLPIGIGLDTPSEAALPVTVPASAPVKP